MPQDAGERRSVLLSNRFFRIDSLIRVVSSGEFSMDPMSFIPHGSKTVRFGYNVQLQGSKAWLGISQRVRQSV